MKAHHPCLEKLLIQFLFRFETSVSESSDHSRDAIKAPKEKSSSPRLASAQSRGYLRRAIVPVMQIAESRTNSDVT